MSQLWDAMVEPDNLWNAWEDVQRRSSMPGVDGQSVADFERTAPSQIAELRRELRWGRYQPQPLKGLYIPKPSGGWRIVGVPTVRDRIAQRACLNVLQPLLEPHLEECSYAYRPGRSIADALRQVEAWRDRGHDFLLESDIENCFDSIDRELLLRALARHVAEKRMLDIVQSWLSTGTLWTSANADDLSIPVLAPSGIPQGSVLSPLLCNLFLDGFDEALLRQRFKLVRYADDFVIVATRRERTEDALHAARAALSEIGLQLRKSKTRLTSFEAGFRYLGTDFLGAMALGTIQSATGGNKGQSSPSGGAGYPGALPLPPDERPPQPDPPTARGLTAVSSAVAYVSPGSPLSPIGEALNKALLAQRQNKRRQIRHETPEPWETSYLV